MRFIAFTLMLLLLAVPQLVRADDRVEQDRQAVLVVQEKVDSAMLANDADAMAPLLTDNFTRTPPTGILNTKAQWLESVRNNSLRYVSVERTDTDVRLFGDSAIVTGIVTIETVKPDTGQTVARNRYLRVYVRENGNWRLAAHQATTAPAPAR